MSFFRKWKTHYKHKKFSSNDSIHDHDEGYEYGLATSIQQMPKKRQNIKFDNCSGGGGSTSELKCIDSVTEADDKLHASFNIKYLGCAPIRMKPSEKTTSEAIAQVIANSKAGGRKNKTQKRVNLNVSEEGLQVLDYQTQETLMTFSIYKVSYCSVDAAHDHAFSFVGSELNPTSSEDNEDSERLSCHVFLCPKRKVAHEITLLVARCFERAYQQWRDAVVLQSKDNNKTTFHNSSPNNNKILNGVIESRVEVHQPQQQKRQQETLIDLAVSNSDTTKYFNHSWVSFDDDGSLQVTAY